LSTAKIRGKKNSYPFVIRFSGFTRLSDGICADNATRFCVASKGLGFIIPSNRKGPMKLVFIDESGYARNWQEEIKEQPFYVIAGICIDARHYRTACQELLFDIDVCVGNLRLDTPLGQGSEVKAKHVAKASGRWHRERAKADQLRDLMLSFPKTCHHGVGFVVVFDLARHLEKYGPVAQSPVHLGMKYLFERLEHYGRSAKSDAYCIYDHDTRRTMTFMRKRCA